MASVPRDVAGHIRGLGRKRPIRNFAPFIERFAFGLCAGPLAAAVVVYVRGPMQDIGPGRRPA
jgi:hypothetical protein